MKWFKMMMVFAVAIVACSSAFAQGPPAPVPDPGPSVSTLCEGIEATIASQQAEYDTLQMQIDALDAEIEAREADLAEIIASPYLTPEEKAIATLQTREAIRLLNEMIDDLLEQQAVIAAYIHALWDSWFECGCDD